MGLCDGFLKCRDFVGSDSFKSRHGSRTARLRRRELTHETACALRNYFGAPKMWSEPSNTQKSASWNVQTDVTWLLYRAHVLNSFTPKFDYFSKILRRNC